MPVRRSAPVALTLADLGPCVKLDLIAGCCSDRAPTYTALLDLYMQVRDELRADLAERGIARHVTQFAERLFQYARVHGRAGLDTVTDDDIMATPIDDGEAVR